MSKITPTLWYDGTAEEAARFYVTLLPGGRIEAVNRSPIDTPSTISDTRAALLSIRSTRTSTFRRPDASRCSPASRRSTR